MVTPLAEKARAERKTPDADNPFLSNAGTGLGDDDGVDSKPSANPRSGARGHVPCDLWLALASGLAGNDAKRRTATAEAGHVARSKVGAGGKDRNGRTTMDQGGPLEAEVRALVYIALGQRVIDARSFEILRRTVAAHPEVGLARYKAIVREQWARLTIDQEAALKALPRLLPVDADARRDLYEEIKAIRMAAGKLDGEAKRRLDEVDVLFDIGTCAPAPESRTFDGRVS